MEKSWNFSFGKVIIKQSDKTLLINTTLSKDDFEERYSHLLDTYLSKDSKKFLIKYMEKPGKEVFVKSNDTLFDLIRFFGKMEEEEKSGAPMISEAAYEPGEVVKGDLKLSEESGYKIIVEENVNLTAEHDGTPKESKLTGKITVANQAPNDRVWDIDIALTNTQNTDIADDKKAIHITELDKDATWESEYQIKTEQIQKPPLNITEKINTWTASNEENHNFILNKEVETQFTIVLENNSKVSVTQVEITKEFLKSFKDIKKLEVQTGDVNIEDNVVQWKVSEIKPNSKTLLKLSTLVAPDSTDPVSTGNLTSKYVLTAGTFSGIDIKSADGFSKNVFTINKDERDEEPDTWDCNFVFYNKSEFPMLLEHIDILSGDVNTEEKAVRFDPRIVVAPGNKWESEQWALKSEDVPTFGKRVLFTVLPDIMKTLSASLSILPIDLYVLSFKGEKTYDVTELPSFRVAPVKAVSEIWSEGPVAIESLIIEDKVPADFRPPKRDAVKLIINDKEIDSSKYTIDITPSVDYDAKSYPSEHSINVKMKDVQEIAEPGSELDVKLEYEMTAIQTKPNTEYAGPCIFKAYTIPRGPEIELVPEDIITTPIKVVHVRRKESVSKLVVPAAKGAEYEIFLTYKNRGNSTLAEKTIIDQVPTNFQIVSMEPKGKTESIEEGTKITWTFNDIEAGNEIEAKYVIKGTGEFEAGQTAILTKD
jgi:hypothetical protein